uniref:Uncharacterized protein n=1 Tax=Populus alba TaxID=43335 RepID=A0A4U5PMU8_POPAL|nr:hypothetical protein D5086_0000207710 [Populus alba]
MQDTVDDSEGMWSSSESEDDEENDSLVCIMADRNLWSTQGSSMNRIAASAKLFDILEYTCHLHRLPLAVTWISYGKDGNTNSKGKRILCIDDSACYVNHWGMYGFMDEYARYRLEEGKGIAGKALQSNIHIQHDISLLDPSEFPDMDSAAFAISLISTCHAAFAVRLTSTHPCKDDYVLEFHLPEGMKETSELEILINKVLRTLRRKCLKMWEVSVREVNEARKNCSEVRLDDERMSNIPHEENGYMTVNPTSNQAEETREPLEQDVQEQSAIPAPALNGENASLSVDAVLDPSYKLDFIEYGYRQIYGSDADLHLSRFRYDLTCAYHKYAEDISNQGPSSSAMADVSRCTSSDISFKEWRKVKYERNMVHSQWNELDQYLQLPPEKLDKDGDVLAWWQDNARNFPILGKMARDFLAIPVSTVISKSSEVMKMASVHDGVRPEMAEALICGKDWLDSPNCK